MRDMAIKLFVLALTVSTATAQVIAPSGDLTDSPAMLSTAGGTFQNPPLALLTAAGYSLATPAQIAEAQAAKDAAAALATANATLPQVFPSGVAVIDPATGHHIELLPTGDGLPVIGAQVSSSPLSKEQRDAMKAERKAAHDALKAKAKDAKNDKDKIAALMEAVFGKQ